MNTLNIETGEVELNDWLEACALVGRTISESEYHSLFADQDLIDETITLEGAL